jgi:predicted RNA-binding protein (virulence factor B family)
MAEIGKTQTLEVIRSTRHGLILNGEQLGDILLPQRYVPQSTTPIETVEVFLMFDSEDRLVATTLRPTAQVDEFAWLRVVSTTRAGTFLDWGLPKDLFVPFREQTTRMEEGRSYMVRVYLDTVSNRIAATARLNRFLDATTKDYNVGQAVDLLICAKTDLGYKAIVDNRCWGLLFQKNVFKRISCGQRLQGYIQQVRDDGKLCLCLDPPGYDGTDDVANAILAHLQKQGGSMPITDKSAPDIIYKEFGVSKKAYKRAIGALYKSHQITITKDGTQLVSAE